MVVRDSDGALHPTLTTGAYEREGRFAPVGQSLADRSNETGRDEVYVQSYPLGHGKWQISTDGGAQAMWAANGRELFVLTKAEGETGSTTTPPITLVLNYAQALKR